MLGAVAGWALPRVFPGALPGGAVATVTLAGLVLLAAGLVHAVVAQRGRTARLEHGLAAVADALAEAQSTIDSLRAELASGGSDKERVAAELRMLQSLLKQLTEQKAQRSLPTPAAAARTPPPASAGAAAPAESAGVPAPARPSALPAHKVAEEDALDVVRDALAGERVDLYLQPIVSLPQRKRVFYECFSRIRDAEGRVVTPDQYLPVAEQAGLVTAIDNMLLFRAVQLIRRTRRDHLNVGFFCNISSRSLADAGFFNEFIDFLAANQHLAPSLSLELDQPGFLAMEREIGTNLQRLAAYGFRFSLDQVQDLRLDLPRLAALGFKHVKLDCHLLHEVARGASPRLDMRSFKGALDRVAMDLIVEKIETEEMLRDMLDLNVDFGQGYLFGEPRPSNRVE